MSRTSEPLSKGSPFAQADPTLHRAPAAARLPMIDDTFPNDDDFRPPSRVGLKIALGLAGVATAVIGFALLASYSRKSEHRRRVSKALLSYSFPPQKKLLEDLLPAPVSDIEIDGECSSTGKRYGIPMRSFFAGPTSCETRAVTVVTTAGQRYRFHTSGIFSAVTFVPADENAKALLYGAPRPPASPLAGATSRSTWIEGFRKEWPSPGFTVIERTQVISGENASNSAVTLLSSDNKELCNLVSTWEQDLDGPQKLRIYIRDHDFLAKSGSHLIETALSLYVRDYHWNNVAAAIVTKAVVLWDGCVDKATAACSSQVRFDEIGEPAWWPPIELEVQARILQITIEG